MRHRVLSLALLVGLIALCDACTIVRIDAAPPASRNRVLQADRETVWITMVQLFASRDVRLTGMDHDQGWMRTDFIYFSPMDFGEPVLAGTILMGDYLDVEGGRYRLLIQLAGAGDSTSVHVEAEVERLVGRRAEPPAAEPSFSLDAPMQRRSLVQVPQPSNGVIERRFFGDVMQAIADREPPAATSRITGEPERP